MIKNIIFDWAGVIIDSTKCSHLIANYILKSFNIPEISLDEFRRKWEMPYMNFYEKYIPNLSLEKEREAYDEAVTQLYNPEIFPDVKNILNEFKKNNIRMFVVSGDLEHTFNKEIEKYNLENIFEKIYLDSHNKFENVREIIDENNLNKDETLIIGDSTHEIEIGKKFGIISVGITRGFQTREKLESAQPDYIIDNFKELEDIVLNK